MRIEFDKNVLDLGFTPVENMFIHTYLSLADGDQIKVYLYALSQAYNTNGDGLTNENIAFEMGLTEGQVIDAWKFWEDQGLVEIIGDRYIFKSLRSGYISQMMGLEVEENLTAEINQAFEDNKYENKAFKELIDNIEDYISSGKEIDIALTPREIESISEQIRNYNLTYDYYSYAFNLASSAVDSKNIAHVNGVIRNWVIDGATDEAKLDALLEKKSQQKEAMEERKASTKVKSTKKPDDDRMSREERKRFIEEKMKKRRKLLRED